MTNSGACTLPKRAFTAQQLAQLNLWSLPASVSPPAVRLAFLQRFPQWTHAMREHDGVFEVTLQSPISSRRLFLTTENEEISIYFIPFPWHEHFDGSYGNRIQNALDTFEAIYNEELYVVNQYKNREVGSLEGGNWTRSTKLLPSEEPKVFPGEVAEVRSFRGTYDRDVRG
jgi:hypothetical protein